MKNICINIILPLLLIAFFNQKILGQDGWHFKVNKLKGKVKSITEMKYPVIENFGKLVKKNEKAIETHFIKLNNNGNILIEIGYDKDSLILYSYSNDYNERHQRTEHKQFDKDGNVEWVTKYTYNDNGKLIVDSSFYNGVNFSYMHNYEYDEDGNLTEKNEYNSNGNFSSKYIYVYNLKKQLIEEKGYNSQREQNIHITYKYDEFENLFKKEYFKNNKVTATYEYEYDKNRNLIEEKGIGENKYNLLISKYTYNEQGDCTGSGTFKITHTSKFDYDRNENWVKSTNYYNDKPEEKIAAPTYIIERKIEYYY
jgi:hypothetical protein